MYVPRAFRMDEAHLRRFLAEPRSAQLVTATVEGPDATKLPVMYRPDNGPHGTFVAHMSRVNPQWRSRPVGEALLILSGPEGHIAAEWTPEAAAERRAVPTWNYVEVHAFGEIVIHDDPTWVRRVASELAVALEPTYDVDELAEPFGTAVVKAIVGIELRVSRFVAKAKLSQNRSASDLDAIVSALQAAGSAELAAETVEVACPYVAGRDAVVAAAADRHSRG